MDKMRKASSLGKEWYEQAAGFCAYVTGKTLSEIKGLAVDEKGKAADADLAASVTVGIGEFKELIEKAAQYAAEGRACRPAPGNEKGENGMKRRLMALGLVLCLLNGCAAGAALPAQNGLKRYEASFLTLFDTVTTVVGYGDAAVDENVDALTGATVTSKAVTRAVNAAAGWVTGADVSSSATEWGG